MENSMSIVFKTLNNAIKESQLKVEEFFKEIEVIKFKIKEEQHIIEECKTYIQANCAHQNTHRVQGMYMPGGYDHVSESPYTIECLDCGKVLESKCIRRTYA